MWHFVTASSLHSPWLYLLDALKLRNITEGFASAQSLSKVPDGAVTKTPTALPLQCWYLQYLAGRLDLEFFHDLGTFSNMDRNIDEWISIINNILPSKSKFFYPTLSQEDC